MAMHSSGEYSSGEYSSGEYDTGRGRHRNQRRSTRWLGAALVCAVSVGGVAAALTLHTNTTRSDAAVCPLPGVRLRVAATPEIATIVRSLAKSLAVASCTSVRVQVSAISAASVVAGLGRRATGPDVWIPDSSLWLAHLRTRKAAPAISHGSLVRSPVVLAIATSAARTLGPAPSFRRLIDTATTARPVVLGVGDASRSAAALVTLADFSATFAHDSTALGNFAALLRTMTAVPGGNPAILPPHPADGSAVAIATTEHAVWAVDDAAGAKTYTAIYPPAPGPTLDYPFVTLTHGVAIDRAARALLAKLVGAAAAQAFSRHGFRSTAGTAGAALVHSPGVDATFSAAVGSPDAAQVDAVLRTLAVVSQPSRLLALIDVSGSMSTPVPGATGSTRIEIARTAAAEVLGMLPADTVAGLWRFSADLTPVSDYQQLVGLGALDDAQRGQLGAAISRLQAVPNGGTGLYDSIFAAVTTVRRHFDPKRVNSVVVVTDGKDEADAAHAIALPSLLAALKAESTSTRPVKVVAVAYGPDSDPVALRSISEASGGILYTSANPRDLPAIMRNVIGRRLCRASC